MRRTRKFKLKTERIQKTNNHDYLVPEEYEALYNACRHPETKILINNIFLQKQEGSASTL